MIEEIEAKSLEEINKKIEDIQLEREELYFPRGKVFAIQKGCGITEPFGYIAFLKYEDDN